ncbi:PH domain-containing protein [Streptomyces sp. NPDC054797]
MHEGALPREYRHGRKGSVAAWIALGGGATLLFLELWTSSVPPRWLQVLITVVLLPLFGWTLVARQRQFTRVDHKGISRGTGLGVRRIAWRDLHDIRTVTQPRIAAESGMPAIVTYAYRADGRRLLLPCVDDVDLPAVEHEVLVLQSLFRELRGADWAPDPRAESRIAQQTARVERSYRWMSGWRVAVLGVVFAVVLLAGIIGYPILFYGS